MDFKTTEEAKKDFLRPRFLSSQNHVRLLTTENPKAKQILELITQKQVNIFDIYTPATYEELAAALEIKLENERRGATAGSAPRGADRTVTSTPKVEEPDDNVVLPTEEEIAAATQPAPVAE